MPAMTVDGNSVEVEHDPVRGTVSIQHPTVNGGEWLEERSSETANIKTRHDLYVVVRRMLRAHRT
jgi:hypothetical protein